MDHTMYRVAGWIKRRPGDRPYGAEFGYYPTIEAAHKAASVVATPGCMIRITLNGQVVAIYENGEPVDSEPRQQ